MVSRKISELTPLTGTDIASTDAFVIYDTSAGDDKSVTVADAASRFTGIATGFTTSAGAVTFAPVGTIAGADVQTAVAEVATDAIARELTISQSLQTTSLYALSIAQSLTTTSTQLSLTSAAVNTVITNLATTSNALNVETAIVSGHIASTTVVHGIADTATLLRTGSIGVSVQAFDATLVTTGVTATLLPKIQTIRNVTSTNYTLVVGDINNIVEMNTATCQVVIPVGLTTSTGIRVDIVQYGQGPVTVTSDNTSTVHVRTALTKVLKGKYAVTTWYHHGSDEWIGGGDLT